MEIGIRQTASDFNDYHLPDNSYRSFLLENTDFIFDLFSSSSLIFMGFKLVFSRKSVYCCVRAFPSSTVLVIRV